MKLRTLLLAGLASTVISTGAYAQNFLLDKSHINDDTTATIAAQTKHALEEKCRTCPPPLGPLKPATVAYVSAEGKTVQSSVQKLARTGKKDCERFTAGIETCIYEGESVKVNQPLTKIQKEHFSFVVSKKGLSDEVYNAYKNILADGVVTFDELEQYKDVLPHNASGRPFIKTVVFPTVYEKGFEKCQYGIPLNVSECPPKKIPPAIVIPPTVVPPTPAPPVVEVPPPSPPVVTPPPIVEVPPELPAPKAKPWTLTLLHGKDTNDVKTMMPGGSKYCPAPCTEMLFNQDFTSVVNSAQLEYATPKFKADFSATDDKMKDDQKNFGSFGGLKKYFATGVEEKDLALDVTKTFTDWSMLKPGVTVGGSVSKYTTSDAKTSRTDSGKEIHAELDAVHGDLDKSHVGVGVGVSKGDTYIFPGAPTFYTTTATEKTTTPYAHVFFKGVAENPWDIFGKTNTFEIFGGGKYFKPKGYGNSYSNQFNLTQKYNFNVGASWMFDFGRVQVGPTVDYGQQKIQFNLDNTHKTGSEKQVTGGITIRF